MGENIKLTCEAISFGYAVFDERGVKIAVIVNSYFSGLRDLNGLGICKGHTRDTWEVNWTSPKTRADMLFAMAALLSSLPVYNDPAVLNALTKE